MVDQQIICSHVQCSREGVQVRPIPGPPRIGEVFAPRIMDPSSPQTGDLPPGPLGTTHLGVLILRLEPRLPLRPCRPARLMSIPTALCPTLTP